MLDLSSTFTTNMVFSLYRRLANDPDSLAVVKRSFDGSDGSNDGVEYELPGWGWALMLVNLIAFLPVLIFMSYTFQQVFPVLAMVEDEHPPAYEALPDVEAPVAPAPSSDMNKSATQPTAVPLGASSSASVTPLTTAERPTAASSSFRSLLRLMRSTGGFRSYFRGVSAMVAYNMATGFLVNLFNTAFSYYFTVFASLFASLALVQLHTAWVHIVLTAGSPLHFWQRLPAFGRTFNATFLPTIIYWFAFHVAQIVPMVLSGVLMWDVPEVPLPGKPAAIRPVDAGAFVWKTIVIILSSVLFSIFFVIPARVVLARVQASFLPEGEDPIVSFDRSFGGAVVPAVVGGRGYATIKEAWSTFTRGAWIRLVSLYVKIFLVNTALTLLIIIVVVPQILFVASHATLRERTETPRLY